LTFCNVHLTKRPDKRHTYDSIPDCDEFIADEETTIHLSSAALHHFSDINTVITGDVLIADATGDAEAETFVAFYQFDLHQSHIARLSPSSYALPTNYKLVESTSLSGIRGINLCGKLSPGRSIRTKATQDASRLMLLPSGPYFNKIRASIIRN
jgi:hypothetical protein